MTIGMQYTCKRGDAVVGPERGVELRINHQYFHFWSDRPYVVSRSEVEALVQLMESLACWMKTGEA
jgi:hypothetical protein